MSWAAIDDNAPEHRKLLAVGPVACWLWVCGIAYCNRQKARDGFIPETKISVLYPIPNAKREAEKLVAGGLWERVDGGFLVHDYHDYQPSAEEVEAMRQAKRRAGSAGGKRSGEVRRAKAEAAKQTKQVLQENEAGACEAERSKREAKRSPSPPLSERLINPLSSPQSRETDQGVDPADARGPTQLGALLPLAAGRSR
jgi:hypothetical protein